MWTLLRPADRTNSHRTLAFVLMGSAGSVVDAEIGVKNASFPTAMFKLLEQPELGPAYQRVSACMMDSWSVVQQESSVLGSLENLLKLVAEAECLQTNTVPNEVDNANLRRQVKSRVQAKTISVMDLSSYRVGTQFRSEQRDVASVGRAAAKQLESVNKKQKLEDSRGKVERTKCFRGVGGPAKAYAHEKLSGLGCNLKACYEQYKMLGPEDKQEYIQKGKEALQRAKDGLPAFQPKQVVEAARQREILVAAADRYTKMDQGEGDAARIDNMIVDLKEQGKSSAQIAKALTQLQMEINRKKNVTTLQNRVALAKLSAENKEAVTKRMVDHVPAMKTLATHFSVLPPVFGVWILEVNPDLTAVVVANIVSFLDNKQQEQSTNANAFVDLMYVRLNRLLPDRRVAATTHGPAQVLDEEDDDQFDIPPCNKAGLCICNPTAKATFVPLRNRLFAVCKAAFHKDNPVHRKLFLSRHIVMRLVYQLPMGGGLDEDVLLDWGLEPIYFHIARPRLSPYELVLQPMKVATEEERVRANAFPNEICLSATGRWLNTYRAMQEFVKFLPDIGITIDWFVLATHDRPLGEFLPGLVLITSVDVEAQSMWPVRVRNREVPDGGKGGGRHPGKGRGKGKGRARGGKGKGKKGGGPSSLVGTPGPAAVEDGSVEPEGALALEDAHVDPVVAGFGVGSGVPVVNEHESEGEEGLEAEADDPEEKLVADMKVVVEDHIAAHAATDPSKSEETVSGAMPEAEVCNVEDDNGDGLSILADMAQSEIKFPSNSGGEYSVRCCKLPLPSYLFFVATPAMPGNGFHALQCHHGGKV